MSEGTQDSPKVPEGSWPDRIEISCGSNICGDPIYSVEAPNPKPRDDYNPETETYIPVFALFSDEAQYAAVDAINRLRHPDSEEPDEGDPLFVEFFHGLQAAIAAVSGSGDE